ncbi:MAG: DinB family protein [Acidobacteriota bacterium]
MTTHIADRFRRLFEYEKDAHAKVIASLDAVSADKRSSPLYQKAVDLVAHICAARRMWLFRFGATDLAITDLFPQGVAVSALTALADEMHRVWSDYLSRLDDAETARVFKYCSLDGREFRNSVEDILTQLFGHSLYHHGQIALLLRQIGEEPAATDFVYWSREAIE